MVLSRDRISPEVGNPFTKDAEVEKCQGSRSGTKPPLDITDKQSYDLGHQEDNMTIPGPLSPKENGSDGVRDSLPGREVTSSQRNQAGEEQTSANVSVRKMTNFSIDQILRDDFGPQPTIPRSAFRRPPSTSSLSSPSLSSLSLSPSSLFSLSGRSLCFDLFGGPFFHPMSPLAGTPCPPASCRASKKFSCEKRPKECPRSPFSASSPLSSAAPPELEKPRPSSRVPQQLQALRPKQETGAQSHDVLTECKTNDSASNPPASCPQLPLPAWVYCTRYSDRPSSGPRYRKSSQHRASDKRPRTAFSSSQLQRLKTEFQDCPYLSESRRVTLSLELGLSESQVKIWFQNKRAKLKKSAGVRHPLASLLMQEGLYNHSTITVPGDSSRKDGADS